MSAGTPRSAARLRPAETGRSCFVLVPCVLSPFPCSSLFFAEERKATPGRGSGTIIYPDIQKLWGEFCIVISLIFGYLRLLAYARFRVTPFSDSPHNVYYAARTLEISIVDFDEFIQSSG